MIFFAVLLACHGNEYGCRRLVRRLDVQHGRMHIYTEEGPWFVSRVHWMARKYEVVVLSSRV